MELWAGELGPYQWIQYVLHLLPAFTGGIHMLSQVVLGATPKHRCKVQDNATLAAYVGSCHYLTVDNETLPCQAWEYDQSDYHSTIVSDWDLVCDHRWMAAFVQSVYMLGSFTGSIILGPLSDRYGRWKVLIPTGILQLLISVVNGFVGNFYLYSALRFILAANVSGAYMIGFVLTMEFSPDRYRTPLGFGFQLVFALGIAAVAGWGYLIRDWPLLQITFGLNSAILLVHWWLVDESPRWLFSQGRYKEAEDIIRKSLVRNNQLHLIPAEGLSVEHLRAALTPAGGSSDSSTGRKYGLIDLFRTPRLRNRTLNISLNWFANSLAYYGLSLNTGALVGNPYLMLFISGMIEVPAYLCSVRLIDKLGRRPTISFCLGVGGLACIVTSYFPQSSWSWTTTTTVVVMLGKSLISISFAIIYNFTAELFPTVVRSTAVGTGSTCARVSGTLTPLIFLLDSLDPRLPSVLFGLVAILAGFFSLYLPETCNQPLPHSLQDGEQFGVGDTFFASLFKKLNGPKEHQFEPADAPLDKYTQSTEELPN